MTNNWADRQRRTNALVRSCYQYLSNGVRLNDKTIHALCELTWITKGSVQDDSGHISSVKMRALSTVFNQDYQQWDLEKIAQDVESKWHLGRAETIRLITQHTGFTNFYNVYRNSSLGWIRRNIKSIKTVVAQAYGLNSDNDGALIAEKIEALSGIPSPDGNRSIKPEYLLTPLCFCLDSRIRFPIINGNAHVTALLREFNVFNKGLGDKYSALVALIGKEKVKDAADVDQLRTWKAADLAASKKQFKLAIPKSKNLALKDVEDYEVLKRNLNVKARRVHNELTNQLLNAFNNKIVEGSDPQCKYDALVKNYDGIFDLLIEVKSSVEVSDVRMAIGQLLDYHRQLDNRVSVYKAVLLPKEPAQSVKDLLKYADIGLLWFKDKKLVETWW